MPGACGSLLFMTNAENISAGIKQASALLPLAGFALDGAPDWIEGQDERAQLENLALLADGVAAILQSYSRHWRAALDQEKSGEVVWK